MNPTVVWTFRGERQLHFLLTRLGGTANLFAVRSHLSQQLRDVFHDAVTAIVLDMYFGFSDRADEYTLLVDVRRPEDGEGGTVVVKLAGDQRLRGESEAWVNTREPQFNGDGVLMRQLPAHHPQYRYRIIAVLYQDAVRHIGMDRQVSLEEAFVGCVRYGTPTPESMLRCLEVLFTSLNRELYAGGRPRAPLTADLELNPDNNAGGERRSLVPSLDEWTRGGVLEVVQAVEAAVGSHRGQFLSPVSFFRRLRDRLQAVPPAGRYAVPLTRGPAHGDLHGRNVLVGIEGDVADRPAVYDYEHMNKENLIGLDFAKLETELKVRVYPSVLDPARPREEQIRRMHLLESALAALAPRFEPPHPHPPATPAETRLFALLQGIRRAAERTLSPGATNPRHWQKEFFLLLAAYGLYTVRFPQTPAHRTAAYLSAGAAAAAAAALL